MNGFWVSYCADSRFYILLSQAREKVNWVELQERINEGFLAEHTLAMFSKLLYQAVTEFLSFFFLALRPTL